MAFAGSTRQKGIIIEPPADHPKSEGTVCVKFTPPVPDGNKPNHFYNVVTCDAQKVEVGWQEPSD